MNQTILGLQQLNYKEIIDIHTNPLMIIAFLIVVSFMMHSYWKNSDPMARMADMAHFYKNMALAGASLMLIASF